MATIAEEEKFRIERLVLGPWGTNAYIVVCRQTGDSVLIDTPAGANLIMDSLKGTNIKYILITHSHGDHLGALAELHSRLKVPVAAHAADAGGLPVPTDMPLNNNDEISFGRLRLRVLHTPGHTPGSICFHMNRYLLSGDTIFPGGPGRTGSPEALRQIIESITGKIFPLPDDTQIYPGHGDTTILKKEKEEYAVFASRPHRPNLCGDVLWLSS